MRPVLNRSNHKQRGTALIETAIMLPLLTVMLLGVVNMGLVIREHQVLQNAAREGARYAALPANRILAADPAQQAQVTQRIQTRVQQYLAEERIPIQLSDVTINQDYTYSVGSMTVKGSQVTVTHTPSMLTRTSFLWPFGPMALRGQAVFRNLYY